ncbi:class I SAM-dependent rRNA methyltransferase [Adhaeribacter rhizoryzae]|uniref:Class I SAM-dependent rRNA methyltransferase n=1 Tax=Adhaeribacter rhizoryzae TaxID=2607907 RepID=A0A5M6DKD8_9BACT|nr:class I SAM-dependent rRNA methyltransferase [Adhaeribacter rhizoryzae]KAA5546670.1 class I SAM-dependent rRNA methyltransferase [Adhaeribacter rhizoryzae]
MKEFARVILHGGKDHSLKRRHPWVFSGAIKKIQGEVAEGEAVEVFSAGGEYLGTGHYQPGGSIAVRIFSFERVELNFNFWKERINQAYTYRRALNFIENNNTNVYRLVFAEGDSLPGLVVDVYNNTAVMQCHTIGMYRIRETLAQAIVEVGAPTITAVYDKSAETLLAKAAAQATNGYLIGEATDSQVVQENNNKFTVDWVHGQKTGFFIDQRENRSLLAQYSQGKSVLNTFCYTGGFSIYSLNAGASLVHSVDSSKKAIELTDKNVELNGTADRHESFAVDTFSFLKENPATYDIIILDPPAFAKHQNVRHNAVMGYKRLNVEGIKHIKPSGILFTFSCSQVVDRYLFNNTVMAAAIEAGRNIKIMHQLSQPADHPVSIYHPEGEYLKGLVLYVE